METHFRSKLPRTQSFPIGLEKLRAGLSDAPQLDRLQVWFTSGPWRTAPFRKALLAGELLEIATVSYRPASRPLTGSRVMVDRGDYDESWELRIEPTLREYRALANRLLTETGLPAIASWLRSAHARLDERRTRSLTIRFDPVGEQLVIRETVGP